MQPARGPPIPGRLPMRKQRNLCPRQDRSASAQDWKRALDWDNVLRWGARVGQGVGMAAPFEFCNSLERVVVGRAEG